MTVSFAIAVPIGSYHPLLRDCLTSLAIQSPHPKIAVLDASGDPRVSAVIEEFSNHIEFHRSGPDGGQSDAIIEGWRRTESDFLGWLNADDALYPGALAKAAEHFGKNPDTDVFYGNSVIIDDEFGVKGYHWAVEPPSANILASGIISQPSCFFRRTKYEEIGGLDRDLHYTMDWDLWVRFWRAGAKFQFTEETLSRVLWSPEAKTGGFSSERRSELERIISGNKGAGRRLKSRIGFALHHFLEYLAPPVLSRAYRERSARKSRTIHGLDASGGVRRVAAIPLVHYNKEPMNSLRFSVNGEGTSARIKVGAAVVETNGAGEFELILAEPATSGEVVQAEIENLGANSIHLLDIQWR